MSKLSDIIPRYGKTIGEVYNWVGPFNKERVGRIGYREVLIKGDSGEKHSVPCYGVLFNAMDGDLRHLYVLRPVYSNASTRPNGDTQKEYIALFKSYLKWWANDAPWSHMVLYKRPGKILSHGAIVDIGLARCTGEAKACLIAFRLFYEASVQSSTKREFVSACLDIGVTWPMLLSVLPILNSEGDKARFTSYATFSEHSALSPTITRLTSWLKGDVNTATPSSHDYCSSIGRGGQGAYIPELIGLTGYEVKRSEFGRAEYKKGNTLRPSELAEHVLTIQEKYLNAK